MIFIVHTMPRRWVYLKTGLPDAYIASAKMTDHHFCTVSATAEGWWHQAVHPRAGKWRWEARTDGALEV